MVLLIRQRDKGTLIKKRLIVTYLALSALMVAIPATASASPVLTDATGTAVAGSKFVFKNTGNIKMTTSLGIIECTKAAFTGVVKKNSGTEIEETIETASFTGTGAEERCTSSFLGDFRWTMKKLPWCLKAGGKLPADTFELKSGACGGTLGSIELTTDSSTPGECTYIKNSINGSFSTGETGDLTVSEQECTKSGGSGICPGSGKFDFTLDMETDGTSSRIWIS